MDVIAKSMLQFDQTAGRNKHSAPRSGGGRALASWKAEQLRERDRGGARILYTQGDLESTAPTAQLAYSKTLNAGSSQRFETSELEKGDQDLLQLIAARARGWRPRNSVAGSLSKDHGSTMPWTAQTNAQWEQDSHAALTLLAQCFFL